MAISKKEVPLVILGGGLTGLCVAACLEKLGADYFLVEGSSEFGGLARGQNENGVYLDYGLKSLPLGENLEDNPLYQLKKFLDLKIGIDSDNSPTLTLEKSGLIPFMGFGETKNTNLVDEISYYTSSPRVWVSGGWHHLIQELNERIPVRKKILRSQVVRLELQDKKVRAAHINGDSQVLAERFIWTMHPVKLLELLPPHTLANRNTKALTKQHPYTVINLDYVTEGVLTDLKNTVVLSSGGEDEFYVVGRFISNVDLSRQVSSKQVSSWLGLVDAEKAEDEEEVSKTIKLMKRQIQKAFPDLFEKKPWERIIVAQDALGTVDTLSLEADGALQGLENLYMCGAGVRNITRHIGGALQSALKIAQQWESKATAGGSAEVSSVEATLV